MAVDYFLKLDNIPGESVNDYAKNQIPVHTWSWGGNQVSSVTGTGGSGAGKVSMSDFIIMKDFDKATSPLLKAMMSGTHIDNGVLTAYKAGGKGKAYLTVTFSEMFVTSVQTSASSENPTESVTFSYNTVKFEYSTQDEKGGLASTTPVTWNTKANKVV